ncbi:MAG TPA: SCO family protein [Thermomicrobiales bacterium]|nr:SCO family protein [Thermomicrobiales bacterium]
MSDQAGDLAVDGTVETSNQPGRLVRWGLLVLTGGLIVALTAFGTWSFLSRDSAPLPGIGTKQVVDPPREMPDFTLTSDSGQPLQLSDLRGKPVLLFFGFTHCPDICPTTLGEFRQVKAKLGEQGNQAAFVFISVDGSRDTPESLAAYVHAFDPAFVGLTGDEEAVRTIGKDYYLYFERVTLGTATAAGENYTVDHTTYSYLLDAEGRLRVIYPFQSPTQMIADDIESLL